MRRRYPRRGRVPPGRRMMERELAPAAGRPATTSSSSARTAHRIIENLKTVIHAPEETLQLAVYCLLCEGHLIIEDFPGVGKTTLAKALARSVGCEFSRLQFTPDLLPSDVTGVNVFNQRTNEFEFRARAGLHEPAARRRDQPGLAEDAGGAARVHAGAPGHGRRRLLPARAAVHGARHPEPDRVRGDLPAARGRARPLHDAHLHRLPAARRRSADADGADGADAARDARAGRLPRRGAAGDRGRARRVRRGEPQPLHRGAAAAHALGSRLYLGASPRAGIALLRVAKARALAEGRDYVSPDDVKAIVAPVLAHRLILAPEARSSGLDAAAIAVDTVVHTPVPV